MGFEVLKACDVMRCAYARARACVCLCPRVRVCVRVTNKMGSVTTRVQPFTQQLAPSWTKRIGKSIRTKRGSCKILMSL